MTLPLPLRNEIGGGETLARPSPQPSKGTWPPSKGRLAAAAAFRHDQDPLPGGGPAVQLGQGNRGGRLRFADLLNQIPKPPPGAGR